MRIFTVLLLTLPCSAADLTVAAASDLARLGPELAAAYLQKTGQTATFTFASSGLLARQIENGAPYDVFLSANEGFVQEGFSKGWLKRTGEAVYAAGRLALWSRSGTFRALEDLTRPSVLHIAIANPAYAPYGVAAAEALRRSGLWDRVRSNLVYGENIRQTLQYAESGNADVALVSWSLVFDRGGVLVPGKLYETLRQAGAVVSSSRQQNEAKRFLEWLRSPAGRDVLSRHGFKPL